MGLRRLFWGKRADTEDHAHPVGVVAWQGGGPPFPLARLRFERALEAAGRIPLAILPGPPDRVTLKELAKEVQWLRLCRQIFLFRSLDLLFLGDLFRVAEALEEEHPAACHVAFDVRRRDLPVGDIHLPFYTLGGFLRFASSVLDKPLAPIPFSADQPAPALRISGNLLQDRRFIKLPVWSIHLHLPAGEVVCSPRWVVHPFDDYFGHTREELLGMLPEPPHRVLDIGCGEGRFGALLKERYGAQVTGVEMDGLAAEKARGRLDRVISGDAEELARLGLEGEFDLICLNDLLEHLPRPLEFLVFLRSMAGRGGRLLLSVPHVGHGEVLLELIRNRWDYVPAGILCYDHLRFFTRESLEELLAAAGWELERIEPIPGPLSEAVREELKGPVQAGMVPEPRRLEELGYMVTARVAERVWDR